ncbi:hypothetical protein [Erythrobacter sp. THAF29]|uniref:hypothetical protein n=1 Tax=Erythrobacter sp. THAF29 TaxID=2587851 RepID=UPI0012686429|nr:hypothetical protein [Erythrobacter sp. THAF29]QFT78927.1 hypothetical protein FIU90_15370 [Erythrobacter sp. THAF29]
MLAIADFVDAARRLATSRALRIALVAIVPYACVLIGMSVAAHYGAATDALLPVQFFLSQDGSFGEYLEYTLTAASAVMLFALWLRSRALVYLTNALLFVWLTLDNWMQIHEELGQALAPSLPASTGLPVESHHLVEAGLFGAVGLVWLSGLATALRSADKREAVYALMLAGCIGLAAVFGVFVDLLTVWDDPDVMRQQFLAFVEDGGEFVLIIATSALTVAIFDIEYRQREGIPANA